MIFLFLFLFLFFNFYFSLIYFSAKSENEQVHTLIQNINKHLNEWTKTENVSHGPSKFGLPLLKASDGLLTNIPMESILTQLPEIDEFKCFDNQEIDFSEIYTNDDWEENSQQPFIIEISDGFVANLPKELSEYLFNNVNLSIKDNVFPIFIVSWIDNENHFDNLCFSKLKIESKSHIFIIINDLQVDLYSAKLAEIESLFIHEIFLITIPSKDFNKISLEVAKRMSEYYNFPFFWEVDQLLDRTREWTAAVVGKTHPCTVERAMLGIQQTVWELENATRKEALGIIEKHRRKLINSLETEEERDIADITIEKFRNKPAEISLKDIEDYIETIPDFNVDICKEISKKINKFKSLVLFLGMPAAFQVAEALLNYPNLVKVNKTGDKRRKKRKFQVTPMEIFALPLIIL